MKRYSLIALLALALGAGAAHAANIALFADTAFVDYVVGNSSSEASNMQATLEAAGHVVTPFTGTAAASWTAALAGKQVLVIPEQEDGEIAPALPAATITVIQNFVNGGGTLIVADDYSSTLFLNAVFGFSIVLDGTALVSTLNPGAAAGTSFAGGPASLPINNATDGGDVTSSLPAGARCIYSAGTECMVYLIPHSSGNICYLAWDWFNAAPVGTQDGGWNGVLLDAVTCGGGLTPAGPPSTIPALGMSELAALALALAALGATVLRRRRSSPR